MSLGKWEYVGKWKEKHHITFYEELTLEHSLDPLYERTGYGDDIDDDDVGNEDNKGLKFALCHAYAAWIYIFRIYKHL